MSEHIVQELMEAVGNAVASIDLFGSSLGIVAYILQALALYTIAKRREIKKPWIAWIPVVNVWILGSLSDQYRYVTQREVKNRRKWLLGAKILVLVLAVAMFTVLIATFVNTIDWSQILYGTGDDYLDVVMGGVFNALTGALVIMLLLGLPMAAMAILIQVLRWMCIYDVLRSCDPKNTNVYFWVSLGVHLVGVSGLESIFLLICMNKDGGMPPRKQETPAPSYIPPVEDPRNHQPEQNGPEF